MVGYDPGAQGAALAPEEAALAGSAAGMVTRALISPLDVLKIRFQVRMCQCAVVRTHHCNQAAMENSVIEIKCH